MHRWTIILEGLAESFMFPPVLLVAGRWRYKMCKIWYYFEVITFAVVNICNAERILVIGCIIRYFYFSLLSYTKMLAYSFIEFYDDVILFLIGVREYCSAWLMSRVIKRQNSLFWKYDATWAQVTKSVRDSNNFLLVIA